jgi:putative FmdB family regulatory protein
MFCIKGLAMPIYAYRCDSCGHQKDVLQKLSDPGLTVCPACGAATFAKQLTAAGFQLKGSGWYVTDFKGGSSAKKADAKTDSGDGAKTDATKTDAGKGDTQPDTKSNGGKSGDSAAPAKTGDASSSGTSSAPKAAGCGRSCGCH